MILAISFSHALLVIFFAILSFLPIVILIYLIVKLFKNLSEVKAQNRTLLKKVAELDMKIEATKNINL